MNNWTEFDVDLPEQPPFTCYHMWGVLISTNSWFAFIINCLHLLVLMNLKSLSGRPYRHILIHITLGDIVTSLTTALFYTCLPYFILMKSNEYGVPAGLKHISSIGSVFFPLFTCYWIFVFASIEQYYAICQPLRYETSCFIKRLPWFLWTSWVLTCVLVFSFLVLIQVYSLSVQSYQQNMNLGHIIFKMVPWFITIVFLIPILRELKKMAGHQIPAGKEQARNAAIYLIIIFSIFSVYSLCDIALSICSTVFKFDYSFILLERIRNLIKTWYAVLNTIVYGWRTKTYRQYIRDRLRCCRNNNF